MKKYVLTVLIALMIVPCVHAGNDYLQKLDNYSVMSMGNGVLRFTIPLWIYGEGSDNTYYLNPHTANNSDINDSYLWFSEEPGQQARLDGNLLSRSAKQDETIMLWFKTGSAISTLFSAGRADSKHGTEIAFMNGGMFFRNDSNSWPIAGSYTDNEWHHLAIAINRTYNNAAIYVDDRLLQTINASKLSAVSGAMYLGGNGFEGNIDEFAIFEQALPKSMLESFGTMAPVGDEMGLIAYLPFSEMKESSSGIYEQIFSVNNQHIFKSPDGQTVHKIQPLILAMEDGSDIASCADKSQSAPVHDQGKLTKMNFDWAFNNDELLVNLNMLDREINKQTVYITVRDVEDLNGNPMLSPVTWTAFIDKNPLKWEERTIKIHAIYGEETESEYYVTRILNYSGKRHQYTIESLPNWLSVDDAYGVINPTEEKYLSMELNTEMAPGVYEDIIYLTDENGLSEPLRVELTIEALPPYEAPDKTKFNYNMSVCGTVMIDNTYDSDGNDIVYAFYNNECVGMEHISFNKVANTSELYLTVYGTDHMTNKPIRFQLWQASTGKVYDLSPDRNIYFAQGAVYGCGDGNPVILTTVGTERQTIILQPGWNWTSFNLDLRQYVAKIANVMTANEPWSEGDLIKNPATRHFVTYSEERERFIGDFDYLRYIYTYMIYTPNGNTIHISGNNLPADSMYITVRGDGRWSAMPCLLKQVTTVTDALADYYDKATPGDMIKAHDNFAYFSENHRWVGNLSVLRPGEGYFFRRMAPGSVDIRFFDKPNNAPGASPRRNGESGLRLEGYQSRSATNMTMICRVEGMKELGNERVNAYIGSELVGVATKIDSLIFLTIQSDAVGAPIAFRTENGEGLSPIDPSTSRPLDINYTPDCHHGSVQSPIVLTPGDNRVFKIIENNHVIIIRNNEKYSITGSKLP